MKAPVGLLSDRTVLRSKMKGPRPDNFQFAVLIPAGFGAGTPQQEHFKNAGALQKCSPEWAQYFQELKICGHGTVLALTFFAAFRNFHISICSQIVDKLRLPRYYKGNPNTLPRRCNYDRRDLRPLFIRQPERSVH